MRFAGAGRGIKKCHIFFVGDSDEKKIEEKIILMSPLKPALKR
jgi:hypothetical protein